MRIFAGIMFILLATAFVMASALCQMHEHMKKDCPALQKLSAIFAVIGYLLLRGGVTP